MTQGFSADVGTGFAVRKPTTKNAPRLRFREFSGEWVEKRLGPFFDEHREKSNEQDQFEVLTSARSGLVRQKDYYDNDRITDRDNIGFNVIPPNFLTCRSRSDDRRFSSMKIA